jgi:hypothetical protein
MAETMNLQIAIFENTSAREMIDLTLHGAHALSGCSCPGTLTMLLR